MRRAEHELFKVFFIFIFTISQSELSSSENKYSIGFNLSNSYFLSHINVNLFYDIASKYSSDII